MKNSKSPITQGNPERRIKPFWRQDGTDFIAKLGRLDRAIVVRLFTPNYPSTIGKYYGIAHGSFLPFSKEEHRKKFDDPIDCMEFAESIVLEWVQSLFWQETAKEPENSITYQKPLGIESIGMRM